MKRKIMSRVLTMKIVMGLVFLSCWPGLLSAQQVLTLDKAIETAMSKSPTIKHSKMSLEKSEESLKAQKLALKSQFSLKINPYSQTNDRSLDQYNATYYNNWNKSSSGTFTIDQPLKWTDGTFSVTNQLNWQKAYSEINKTNKSGAFSNSIAFNLTQPLFTYNRTLMSLKELELDLENTKLSFAIQMLSLEQKIATNFYNLYQSKSSLDIAVEELKNQQLSYEIIKNKVDAGLSAKEELYQAELNLLSSQASLENSKVSLENSYDSFKQLIGLPLADSISVETDITFQQVSVDLQKAIDNALKVRMELRQRSISILNAQDALIKTAAQNEFKGNLNLSLGVKGIDTNLGDIYKKPTNTVGASISFDIPIWDWGQNKSRMNVSRIAIKDLQLSYEEDKTNMVIAITQAYRNLGNLVSQIEIAGQNIKFAQLTYDINLERYKNGDLTSMDLNLYQTQLSQKKTSLTSSQIDYKLALLNLKIITLWDFEKDMPVTTMQALDN
ncbi:MAG: TolC family protein [Candidatus Latescibacterota bacterium]